MAGSIKRAGEWFIGPVGIGVLGGLGAAAIVLGVLVTRKVRELEARGAQLEREAEAGGSSAFAQRVAALRADLGRYGEAEARRIAEASANDYMARVYGLTPERIARLSRLAQSFGVS